MKYVKNMINVERIMKHPVMISPKIVISLRRMVFSFLIFPFFHFSSTPAWAQQPWTLKQCCDYAVAHNITVKQYENQRRQQELQLSSARNQRLPDLNGSAGQNFSFGRGLTAENTYTNTNTSSTSFSVGTGVPLFTGFQIPNQIKLQKLNLEAATQDLEKARNDIRMQVAQLYVQQLYDMEIAEVAHRQVSIDSAQVARLEALLEVGRVSEAEVAQQRSTLAQSQLTATQADNNRQLSLLNLVQLLDAPSNLPQMGEAIDAPSNLPPLDQRSLARQELGEAIGFAINVPSNLPPLGEALGTAEEEKASPSWGRLEGALRPEIQAAQLRVKAAERSIKIAQAGLYPTLSFSAGLGTNYYTTSGFKSDGFGRQLQNNFSQYVGLNLNIPIFNRLQTRNQIRAARIDRDNQLLALDQAKKQLNKEIQQAYYNTVAAQQKLRSSQTARTASAEAFRLMTAKYEEGKATSTEFNEARNNMLKAESDLTQARYEYLYQTALLRFYYGEPLDF